MCFICSATQSFLLDYHDVAQTLDDFAAFEKGAPAAYPVSIAPIPLAEASVEGVQTSDPIALSGALTDYFASKDDAGPEPVSISVVQPVPAFNPTDEDDLIKGTSGRDDINLLAGDDVARAGAGNDLIFGGAGFDTVHAGEGQDTVYGGFGRDLVYLNQGDDVFIDNSEGGDLGRDTVYGGRGNDTIQGGNGDDIYFGEWGADVIHGRLGNDRIFAGDQFDTVFAGEGQDTVFGGFGRDRVFLGDGDDRFVDTAQTGALGQDTVTGGAGGDVFVFGASNSADTLTDFEVGLDALHIGASLAAGRSAAELEAAAQSTADGVLLDFGGGNSILLAGLASASGLEDDILIY